DVGREGVLRVVLVQAREHLHGAAARGRRVEQQWIERGQVRRLVDTEFAGGRAARLGRRRGRRGGRWRGCRGRCRRRGRLGRGRGRLGRGWRWRGSGFGRRGRWRRGRARTRGKQRGDTA